MSREKSPREGLSRVTTTRSSITTTAITLRRLATVKGSATTRGNTERLRNPPASVTHRAVYPLPAKARGALQLLVVLH